MFQDANSCSLIEYYEHSYLQKLYAAVRCMLRMKLATNRRQKFPLKQSCVYIIFRYNKENSVKQINEVRIMPLFHLL